VWNQDALWRTAAAILLLFLVSVNVYRAWTQSITSDEAFAFNLFLSGAPAKLFNFYDASHHVFHTILCKVSISVFGVSEFSLRIPSLLGGLLYLTTAFRLSSFLFGRRWLFFASFALLSLNPFLLDYMSAARGYGLAVGFFLWSLYQMLQYLSEHRATAISSSDRTLLYKASIGLALSVASNLTLLFPGAGLAALFLSVLVVDSVRAGDRKTVARELSLLVDSFVVPGIATAFVILILPITKAGLEHFYVGAPSLTKGLRTLVALSLYHQPIPWHSQLVESVFWLAERLLAPAVLIATLLACAVIFGRWLRGKNFGDLERIDQFLLLGGGAMFTALFLTVAGHHLFGLLYPNGRTGLYLVPLFVLTALAVWKRIERHRLASIVLWLPLLLITLLCIFRFCIQFQTTQYGEWRYDAGTKSIINLIRARCPVQPEQKVRVGVNWKLEPSMNFYRELYDLHWMEPLDRKGPAGSFDYYVLLPTDAALVEKLNLSVIHKDEISQARLAVPRSPISSP
jgi:hypothetical protein